MRIQRWHFRLGRRYAPWAYINGYQYPCIVACIDHGRIWIGQGVEVSLGPLCLRVMHLHYMAIGFEENE